MSQFSKKHATSIPLDASTSGELEPEDAMMVVSDDGEAPGYERHSSGRRSKNKGPSAQSPNSPNIEEDMILSDDEEEPPPAFLDDAVDYQRPEFLHQEDDVPASPGADRHTKATPKKMWTGRTKKNPANPGIAASSALMVEDKPWRRASSGHNRPSSAAAAALPSSSDHQPHQHSMPPPKSPGRIAQLVSPRQNATLPPSPANFNSPVVDTTRLPLLKYIRGLGGGNVAASSPSSPSRRAGQKGHHDDVAAGPPGVWNDEANDDDHSSVSSDLISYSSIDSMDDSDDDLSMPLDDYVNNPEVYPGFWDQLPYVPINFVVDQKDADMQSVIGSALPYLDQDFKDLTMRDPSQMNDFYFALDHRFFLRALFQLLAERDEVGVEDSIHDEQNIIKKGPLRKKYLGLVKFKFLELRKGNLTYFGDGDGEGRKTIHLRAATASCNAIDEGGSADADTDPTTSSTSPSEKATHAQAGTVATLTAPGMHAAASLSAGLTSAVNATTSAASTIAGGTSVTQGFEFHLWVEGKRYSWLANSKNEQQSWVRAIRLAMIGDKVNDQWGMTLNATNTASHADEAGGYEEALSSFTKVKSDLSSATDIDAYLDGLSPLSSQIPLSIPLKWVRDQMPRDKVDERKDGNSQQRRLKTSIAAFWGSMKKFDFAINGHIIDRDSPHAPERTIGALVRCILDFDRSFSGSSAADRSPLPTFEEVPGQSARKKESQHNKRSETDPISELNAVSFSRSILLSIMKTKTSNLIEFAVDSLCKNENLVQVQQVDPSSSLSTNSETLHIDVSFAGDDIVDHSEDSVMSNEASGWVMVRRSKYNSWKTRFCVFSEGVFSYYENAKPRPHGLRGQLMLAGASLNEITDERDRAREDSGLFILRLTTKAQERERQFGFKSKEDFLEWKNAIQHVVLLSDSEDAEANSDGAKLGEGSREPSSSKKSRRIIEEGAKLISYATDGGMKAIKDATDGGMKVVKGGTKVIKDATGGGVKAIKGATSLMFRTIRTGGKKQSSQRTLKKSPSIQFLMENTRTEKTGKREPTVQCIIQTTSEFKVCSVDSADDAGENVLS